LQEGTLLGVSSIVRWEDVEMPRGKHVHGKRGDTNIPIYDQLLLVQSLKLIGESQD
jgi:hypothetical protein